MSDATFPILGTESIPLVGRQELLARLWNDLTKASPSNLSVVGPKKIGKTVLLEALLEKARADDSPYSIAVCWRLGDSPPQSDEQFVEGLCEQLRAAMEVGGGKYEMHREYLAEEQSYSVLKEVMDLVGQQGEQILMIWDGFDKPLSQGRLSESLFGQLRDLFNGKPHKVVTATRATQSKLARKKEVEDSPFWNMFEINPLQVGPFGNDDLEEALRSASISATQGAKKEILNWTGGHPVLLLSLLNELAKVDAAEINNAKVNTVASTATEHLANFLDGIWDDIPQSTRDSLLMTDEMREIDKDSIGRDDATFLIARGLICRDGRKFKPACRMLSEHVRGAIPDTSTLSRLFGDWAKYRREIRSVLQLRLEQIRPVNARLQRLVKRSLEDIPEFPDDCLNNLTSIEELALDAVWASECPNSEIPGTFTPIGRRLPETETTSFVK